MVFFMVQTIFNTRQLFIATSVPSKLIIQLVDWQTDGRRRRPLLLRARLESPPTNDLWRVSFSCLDYQQILNTFLFVRFWIAHYSPVDLSVQLIINWHNVASWRPSRGFRNDGQYKKLRTQAMSKLWMIPLGVPSRPCTKIVAQNWGYLLSVNCNYPIQYTANCSIAHIHLLFFFEINISGFLFYFLNQ